MRGTVLAAVTAFSLMTFPAAAESPGQQAAAGGPQADQAAAHKVTLPDQLTWQPAPAALPPGAQVAIIQGNPEAKEGTFTLRVKAPAGWHVPPHSHPTDEGLTVISGSVLYGMGKGDKASAKELPAGTFIFLPGNESHEVWVGERGLELQVQGNSPFDVKYVNPDDDPRRVQAQAPDKR